MEAHDKQSTREHTGQQWVSSECGRDKSGTEDGSRCTAPIVVSSRHPRAVHIPTVLITRIGHIHGNQSSRGAVISIDDTRDSTEQHGDPDLPSAVLSWQQRGWCVHASMDTAPEGYTRLTRSV